MKLRLCWNIGAWPLATFVLVVIRLYCALLLHACARALARAHTHTHMSVYMRLDVLAGLNIKTTVVLDVQ